MSLPHQTVKELKGQILRLLLARESQVIHLSSSEAGGMLMRLHHITWQRANM